MDHVAGVAQLHVPVEEASGMMCRARIQMTGGSVKVLELGATESHKRFNRQLEDMRGAPGKCANDQPCNTCRATIKECPMAIWWPEERED